MTVQLTAPTAASTVAGVSSAPTPPPRNSTLGRDTFLKIIAAQLQFQNPMEPMQDKDFLAQMAQFDSLTKLEDVAKSLETLLQLTQLTHASGMIGKPITANVNGEIVSGTVASVSVLNGAATLIVGDRRIALTQVTRIGN